MKAMLGNEYYDHGLVVALPNGRPCEDRLISEAFQRLRDSCRLPRVDFHSLRHSSTTYKLKLNRGDIKATQGDTGHSQADMVTKVYAHIRDEDRKVNAIRMEKAFYSVSANPDLRGIHAPGSGEPGDFDIEAFVAKLKSALFAGTVCYTVLQRIACSSFGFFIVFEYNDIIPYPIHIETKTDYCKL